MAVEPIFTTNDPAGCAAFESGLGHALKAELTEQEKQMLLAFMQEHIPEDEPVMKGAEDLSG